MHSDGQLDSTSPAGLTPVRTLALVAGGGALGVLLRFGLEVAWGDRIGLGSAMVVANVSGSLALGFLVARLRRRGGPKLTPATDPLLALWGTGVLGGYTTYSGLALATVTSARDVGLLSASILLLVTVCGGVLACAVGLRLGSRGHSS